MAKFHLHMLHAWVGDIRMMIYPRRYCSKDHTNPQILRINDGMHVWRMCHFTRGYVLMNVFTFLHRRSLNLHTTAMNYGYASTYYMSFQLSQPIHISFKLRLLGANQKNTTCLPARDRFGRVFCVFVCFKWNQSSWIFTDELLLIYCIFF